MPKMTPKDGDKYWNDIARKQLKGRTIVDVQYLPKDQADEMGLDHRPVVLFLDNGSYFFPMSDDEGNDAGALAVGSDKTLPRLR